VLQLREEPLDQVTLAVEALAEAGLPSSVALGWDVGHGALALDQVADAIGVVGLVCARAETVEQRICDPSIMRLSRR
jgi:hypothetical protein